MSKDQFDLTKAYLVRGLIRTLHRGWPKAVGIASNQARRVPRGASRSIMPHRHLALQWRGTRSHGYSLDHDWHTREFRPGEALYWPANAWWQRQHRHADATFGVSFLPGSVRLVVTFGFDGGHTAHAYHTANPAGPALEHLLCCFDRLDASSSDPTAIHLARGVLSLVLQQVRHDQPDATLGRAEQTWRYVASYLDEAFDRPLTRDSVAAALGFHPNYLSALAQRQVGHGFHDELQERRMRRAEQLLQTTTMTVRDVAEACGFSSDDHFRVAFKRTHNTTPGRWRQQL